MAELLAALVLLVVCRPISAALVARALVWLVALVLLVALPSTAAAAAALAAARQLCPATMSAAQAVNRGLHHWMARGRQAQHSLTVLTVHARLWASQEAVAPGLSHQRPRQALAGMAAFPVAALAAADHPLTQAPQAQAEQEGRV
jgi:hypothetical protein